MLAWCCGAALLRVASVAAQVLLRSQDTGTIDVMIVHVAPNFTVARMSVYTDSYSELISILMHDIARSWNMILLLIISFNEAHITHKFSRAGIRRWRC